MNVTLSIFPKFYQHLSVAELAALVRTVGLDTTNAVVRDGFWISEAKLAEELPRFMSAMQTEEIKIHFATTGYSAAQLIADPSPLAIMAQNGITDFRMGYFQEGSDGPRAALEQARRELEQLAPLCERAGIRAVYQVHHSTLIPGPSAAWTVFAGMPSRWIGVELDPGNQTFEGYEEWGRSCRLLQDLVVAAGIKDSCVTRDPEKVAQPGKGWTRRWCSITEGVTNWQSFLTALDSIHFVGTLVFMPFYHEQDARQRTRVLKEEVAYLRAQIQSVREKKS